MKLVTERTLIQSVLARWETQYQTDMPLIGTPPRTSNQVRDELRLLDLKNASAEKVESIIGNSLWTQGICSECGSASKYGMVLTEGSVFICMGCMGTIADRWVILKELVEGVF